MSSRGAALAAQPHTGAAWGPIGHTVSLDPHLQGRQGLPSSAPLATQASWKEAGSIVFSTQDAPLPQGPGW